MPLRMAGITKGDQQSIGVAPWGELVPALLAAMVLAVVHLQGGGARTLPAAVPVTFQYARPFGAPLGMPQERAVRASDQGHAPAIARSWAKAIGAGLLTEWVSRTDHVYHKGIYQ